MKIFEWKLEWIFTKATKMEWMANESFINTVHPCTENYHLKRKLTCLKCQHFDLVLDILDTQGAQEVKNREIAMESRYRKRTNHIEE